MARERCKVSDYATLASDDRQKIPVVSTNVAKFDDRPGDPHIVAMNDSMPRAQLLRRISDVALLRGEFTLRSGRKSNYYLDKYRFETQPDVLVALGRLFAEKVTAGIDRIAGPELGAVALAAATSMACGSI